MKRALLIGINYRGSSGALNGCINDVEDVRQMLIHEYGYSEESITMMTDDTAKKPTKQNMIDAMMDLVEAAQQGCEEIWLHYSGHGYRVPDYSGDELDGYDEVLIPLDYQKAGIITDDFIRLTLEKLPTTSTGIIFFDCCHSGTLADLPYTYRSAGDQPKIEAKPGVSGDVIMVSGCRDTQTSADAWIDGEWGGAMTQHLIKVLKHHNYTLTCGRLLEGLRDRLKKKGYSQYPILSASKENAPNRYFSIRQVVPPDAVPLVKSSQTIPL